MYDLILKNCQIVNEDAIYNSDIAIKNERIALINNNITIAPKNPINKLFKSKFFIQLFFKNSLTPVLSLFSVDSDLFLQFYFNP